MSLRTCFRWRVVRIEADYLIGLLNPRRKSLCRRRYRSVSIVRGRRFRDRAPRLRLGRFLPAKLRCDRQLGSEVHLHAELLRWRPRAEANANAIQGEEA